MHRIGDKEVSSNVVDGPFGSQLKAEEYQKEGIALLRVSNCRTGEILISEELVYISEEKHKQLIRSQVLPGDVLVTKAGYILGYSAVFPESLEKGNITSHLASIRPSVKVDSRFLSAFLSSSIGNRQIYRWGNKATRPELNTDEVREILIPLPPLSVQREMVAEMEAARASRKAKLAEADALLAGLDSFLLDQLGLAAKKTEYPFVFAARLGNAESRCDADFHSPRFRELREAIENCGHPVMSLKDIRKSIKTGFAAGREVQAFDDATGIPHIRPFNISPFGDLSFDGTKRVPKESVPSQEIIQQNEVLLNNTNSTAWVGKTTVFEYERPCCCSNHITRIVPQDEVIPWFLASLLNAIRSTGYLGLLATNFVNQAGINTVTLESLRIPIPDMNTQQSIVDELRSRRLAARRLREEAAREWEAAKARFEAQLLGE